MKAILIAAALIGLATAAANAQFPGGGYPYNPYGGTITVTPDPWGGGSSTIHYPDGSLRHIRPVPWGNGSYTISPY
jgi:hypothetical protein